jgi:hypothetical protein
MADLTFDLITASSGQARKYGSVYPPTTNPGTTTTIYPERNLTGSTYLIACALFLFDTSALGAGATITGAKLNFGGGIPVYHDDSRSLQLEWYDYSNWPLTTDDYLQDTTGDAGTFALSTLGQYNDLDLATLTGISKTGYTGMRLHITGGQPTGANFILMYVVQLIVTGSGFTGSGYGNKVLGCLPATIAKIMGIPTANVGKFCGV